MSRRSRSPRRFNLGAGLGIAVALTLFLFPAALAAGSEPECAHGTHQSVVAGIVNATGCWTQATVSGATVYTAALDDNPDGIDLNGLVITGDKGTGLRINASTRAVTSVKISDASPASVQLNSKNWPKNGSVQTLGSPFRISFIAPTAGTFQLADLHFGSNSSPARSRAYRRSETSRRACCSSPAASARWTSPIRWPASSRSRTSRSR